jgi:hypothetical protein
MRKQHKNQASNPDHNLPLRPTSPRNPKSAYRFTRHDHTVSSVTGVWLQPSVSTIVASASGAIVAPYLSAAHARLTVVVSYILLGMGFMPAVLIMGMYFHRLAVYKVSPRFSSYFSLRRPCLTYSSSDLPVVDVRSPPTP